LVNLYRNRKETAVYRRRNNTQKIQKHGVHKIENQHTKQENKHKKNIKNRKSSN
jgi:hypothetical protein